MEPVFYDSAAASVVGSPQWTELPEIPSESQLNSPARSLAALERRPLSPALSQVPSVIPSMPSTEHIADTVSLSVLSPLPPSATPDAPVATPSSLNFPLLSDDDNDSDETLSVSASAASFTQASSSFLPPTTNVRAWASTTDLSYNSSVLHPSPSIPSVIFREEEDDELLASFDTSFLRPSSVASSSPRMSSPPLRPPGPIPPSTATMSSPSISSRFGISTPSAQSSPRARRPLPRVPISLATESLISVSLLGSELHLPPDTSPIAHRRQISTPSSQSSLHPTTPHRASTATPASNGNPTSPSGTIIVSVSTPQGSGSTGKPSTLETVDSEPSALPDERNLAHDFDRIVDEIHTYNFTRGLEHEGLINDVRTLKNEVRGLAGLVRIGSLANRAGSPTAQIEQPRRGVTLDAVDRLVGGSSPISSTLSGGLVRALPRPPSPSGSTSDVRSAHSYLSSHHSDDDVLHIEEELLLPPIHSPIWPVNNLKGPAKDSSLQVSSESDSSSLSSSPYASSSELSERWLENGAAPVQSPPPLQPQEIRQIPETIERALEGIQNQIHTLNGSQNANINLLESMQRDRNPEEEDRQASDLLDRLGHIEELLRNYLELGHQQQQQQQQKRTPSPVQQAPPPRPPLHRGSVASTNSVDSIERLRAFMGDLTHHIDNDYGRSSQRDRMSMPPLSIPSPAIPRQQQQRAEDVLQPLDINISPPFSLPQSEIPFIEPFNFLYGDSIIGRGERPRSTSPVSVDRLPPLRHAASVVLPIPVAVSVPGPRRRRMKKIGRVEGEGGGGQEKRLLRPTTPDAERLLSMKRVKRDIGVMKRPQIQDLQQQQQQQQYQQQQQPRQQVHQPSRQVVLRSAMKRSNPTPQVSGFQPQGPLPDTNRTRAVPAERTHSDSQIQQQNSLPSRAKSWYRPRDEQGAKRPMSTAVVDPTRLRYLPMANAPVEVSMPALVPSMNTLRDQRLAQLATVDQQRELMRYMKGVNEWLERDVRNRREEFRDVFQTVEDLRRQIRGMRKRGKGNRERRVEEVGRTPSSRTRPETTNRMDMPQLSSSGTLQAPTTPVGPQPQRWTAVPALLQPYPQQQQQQQRTPVGRANNSSRMSFVPAAMVQPQSRGQANGRMQAQPTIIMLPAGGGRVPAHPVDWQYHQGRDQQRLVERGGTRRSRR